MEQGEQYHIILKGTLPLLMHNIAAMDVDTRPLSDAAAAEAAAYRLPDGGLCMPAAGVRNALISGCSGSKIEDSKTRKKVSARILVSGAVLFADDWFPLVGEDQQLISDYAVDVRSVVIQRNRIKRSRPRVNLPWYLVCTFNTNPQTYVDPAFIAEYLNYAGRVIGIGDFRIEKKGPFGGFEVASIELR